MAIRVAIIGLGKMGLSFGDHQSYDFKVVAVCDSSPLVGGVVGKYGNFKYIGNYDDVLKVPDLQAVVVATPTITHEPMVRKAMERGLNIFCEKPFTLSSAVRTELAALAESKGLISQVSYHNRFIGSFREISQASGRRRDWPGQSCACRGLWPGGSAAHCCPGAAKPTTAAGASTTMRRTPEPAQLVLRQARRAGSGCRA
jgi:hypothetical protein